MPNWTGTPVSVRTVGVTFLTVGGDTASVSLTDLGSVTDGQVTTLKNALAALSNAVTIATNNTNKVAVNPAAQTAFDEAHSTAGVKMVLTFQDADLNIRNIAIPAPDASFFGLDGVTVIAPDDGAAEGTPARLLDTAISVITAIIQTDGGTYTYAGGYRSDRARKTRRPRILPSVAEPGVGDTPPGLPAVT